MTETTERASPKRRAKPRQDGQQRLQKAGMEAPEMPTLLHGKSLDELQQLRESVRKCTYHTERLPVAELQIDTAYQREPGGNISSAKRLEQMEERYSPALDMPLAVNRRSDKKLFVVDGGHRLTLNLRLGRDGHECVVYDEPLSQEQEAWLFYELNGGYIPVKLFERFRARLHFGDPAAVAITAALERYGLQVGGQGNEPKVVTAVSALDTAFRLGQLGPTLEVLQGAWGLRQEESELLSARRRAVRGMSGTPILGTAMFLATYEDADRSRMIEKLVNVDPERVMVEARVLREDRGLPMPEAFASALRSLYNTGIKRGAGEHLGVRSWVTTRYRRASDES